MEKLIGRKGVNITKGYRHKSDYDLRHKIMLVDYRFADRVDAIQRDLNKQMERTFGVSTRSKRPPVSKRMVTGLIAEKLKSPKLGKELSLNI